MSEGVKVAEDEGEDGDGEWWIPVLSELGQMRVRGW